MATPTYPSTVETTNYFRLCKIYVELLRDVLWEVLVKDIPHSDLVTEIRTYLQRVPIHQRRQPFYNQLKGLCQFPSGRILQRTDVDITVVYSLLRNVSRLKAPARGWTNTPSRNDIQVADDVERIRLGRNSAYGHSYKATVSTLDFQEEVKQLKELLGRLDNYLGKNFTEALESIVSDILDSATQQLYGDYVTALSEQERRDREMDDKIKAVETEMAEIKEMLGKAESQNKETEQKLEKLENIPAEVTGNKERTEIISKKLETTERDIKERVTGVERVVGEMKEKLSQSAQQHEAETAAYRQYLIQHYSNELSTVKAASWCDAINALEMIQPLVIRDDLEDQLSSAPGVNSRSRRNVPTSRLPQGTTDIETSRHQREVNQYCQIKCYSEIFYKNNVLQNMVYLLGEAGMGKTTFCYQLINMWCKLQTASPGTEYEKVLHNFKLVLYVRCRHAQKSQSVLDMIYSQICPFQYRSRMEKMFTSCPEKCLVLLDGLDEWNTASNDSPFASQHTLPNANAIHGCVVLSTSRPWKIESLGRNLSTSYRVLEIQGLGSNEVESLSLELLKSFGVIDIDRNKVYESFIRQIEAKQMMDLIKIPLMLVIILISWYKGGQKLKNSLCINYASLLESVIVHSSKNVQQTAVSVDMSKEQLPACFVGLAHCLKYSSLIVKLSELAFDTLVNRNKEATLVFNKQALVTKMGDEDLQLSLDLGLLSESTALSESHECNVSLSFLHKSIQEYLAALHLSGREFDHCFDRFCQYITSLDEVFDSKLLVLFFCGLAPDKGPSIVNHVTGVAGRVHRSLLREIVDYSEAYQRTTKQIQEFIQECIKESDTAIKVRRASQSGVSSFSNLLHKSQRTQGRHQYIIPDVVINWNTPQDKIRQLCCQGKETIKSISTETGTTPLYVTKSLISMLQLEKLSVCFSVKEVKKNLKYVCKSVSHLGFLKAFSFDVFDAYTQYRVKTSASGDLLKALSTVPTLVALHLSYLELSEVDSVMFRSQLSSLSLRYVSVSSQVIAGLPTNLAHLKMSKVSFSESASQQLCHFLRQSSALQALALDLHPNGKPYSTPLTLPVLLDLSCHQSLSTLKLKCLNVTSGIHVSPSQLTYLHMYRVNMPDVCWRELIQSLSSSPSQELTVRMWCVDINNLTISSIESQFTVTQSLIDLRGTDICFCTKAKTKNSDQEL